MTRITTATKKLLKLKKLNRAVSGGTGASKTYSIIMILIDYAQTNHNKRIDVVSESFPHLEGGAIENFREIMIARHYWKDRLWNETKHQYKFETGTLMKFTSFDKMGKAHGPRRDVLFINECNFIPFNVANQLMARTRGVVWLDWNPSEDFWFYDLIYDHEQSEWDFLGDGGNAPPLTYKDNEELSENERRKILSRKHDKNWFRVYGEGMRGEITNRIFTGWKIIDDIPFEARLERRWLDFGFTNDPTAIGDLYYYNGGYIVDELLYQKGLLNKQIADTLAAQPVKALVVADSAEPKSIAEIRGYGANIVGVAKTRGETSNIGFVKWSIGIAQGEKISVTRRSINILKEYRNYLWLVDKNDVIQNVEDPRCDNHHMRGIAYALCNLTPIKKRTELRRQIGRDMTSVPQVNPV